MSNLREKYNTELKAVLQEKLGIKNVMAVPKLTKVVINMGVGEAANDKKHLESAVQNMTAIAGQKPVITKARKSVASFKIREGWPLGCKVTLRGEKMYEFMERLIDIAIPRDIEPEVGQLDDVYLYTIDDLEQVVSDNIDSREKEKVLAQEIIIKQTQVFNKWLSVLPNEQLVQTYRHSVNQIKEEALTDALKRLNNGGDSEQIMTKLADQLANKILHTTFKNIKQTPREALSQCEGCIPNLKK